MKLYSIFTFLAVCLSVVLGAPPKWNDAYMNKMEHFCGQRLSNELTILCRGRYNEAKDSTRPKRGIVNECCFTPCSRYYMKINYCAPDILAVTDSPVIYKPLKEVDYLGYYFELIGHVLGLSTVEFHNDEIRQ